MKKLITPLVVLVAFLIVSALSYSVAEHYTNYQNDRKATVSEQQSQAEIEHQARVKALEAQLAGSNQENQRLIGECQKGEAAYNALTAFNKNRLEAPVCQLEEIQNEEATTTPVQ